MAEIKLPRSPEDFLGENHEKYVELLADPSTCGNIPLINHIPLHGLKMRNLLLRFRGMVQDMKDPEYYLKNYAVNVKSIDGLVSIKRNGLYCDQYITPEVETVDESSTFNITDRRRVLYVASVPGLNSWVTDIEHNHSMSVLNNIANIKVGFIPALSNAAQMGMSQEEAIEHEDNYKAILQRNLDILHLQRSPIPERPSQICCVKIYEDLEKFKLNTVIDVIGFFDLGPGHSKLLEGSVMPYFEDDKYDVIPHLHAIAVHELPHANPLLDKRFLANIVKDDVSATREELMSLLKICLFGDELAAEFLLSHLITRIYKQHFTQNLGKFSLNFILKPFSQAYVQYGPALYGILEQILVASHYVLLKLDFFNNTTFVPTRHPDDNQLKPSLLQLAKHTHLILDETQLDEGQLNEKGMKGILSFSNIIKYQNLQYDFHIYEINFDVDIPVLVLSHGRSILPSDVMIPIEHAPSANTLSIENQLKIANDYLQGNNRLDRFRRYLTRCELANIFIDDDQMKIIQNDFVAMRQSDSKVSVDDLHLLLVFSRLLAISHAKDNVDRECWNTAKALNKKRLERIERTLHP